jgi:hypothetical protein
MKSTNFEAPHYVIFFILLPLLLSTLFSYTLDQRSALREESKLHTDIKHVKITVLYTF